MLGDFFETVLGFCSGIVAAAVVVIPILLILVPLGLVRRGLSVIAFFVADGFFIFGGDEACFSAVFAVTVAAGGVTVLAAALSRPRPLLAYFSGFLVGLFDLLLCEVYDVLESCRVTLNGDFAEPETIETLLLDGWRLMVEAGFCAGGGVVARF